MRECRCWRRWIGWQAAPPRRASLVHRSAAVGRARSSPRGPGRAAAPGPLPAPAAARAVAARHGRCASGATSGAGSFATRAYLILPAATLPAGAPWRPRLAAVALALEKAAFSMVFGDEGLDRLGDRRRHRHGLD